MIILGRGGVVDGPEPLIKGPVCVRRQCEAVGGMVILAKPKWLNVSGLNHHGARSGGERPACEGTGKAVAGKNLVPETGRAAGLPGGLSFL